MWQHIENLRVKDIMEQELFAVDEETPLVESSCPYGPKQDSARASG